MLLQPLKEHIFLKSAYIQTDLWNSSSGSNTDALTFLYVEKKVNFSFEQQMEKAELEKAEFADLELSDRLKIIVQILGIKQGGCLEPWKV